MIGEFDEESTHERGKRGRGLEGRDSVEDEEEEEAGDEKGKRSREYQR